MIVICNEADANCGKMVDVGAPEPRQGRAFYPDVLTVERDVKVMTNCCFRLRERHRVARLDLIAVRPTGDTPADGHRWTEAELSGVVPVTTGFTGRLRREDAASYSRTLIGQYLYVASWAKPTVEAWRLPHWQRLRMLTALGRSQLVRDLVTPRAHALTRAGEHDALASFLDEALAWPEVVGVLAAS